MFIKISNNSSLISNRFYYLMDKAVFYHNLFYTYFDNDFN